MLVIHDEQIAQRENRPVEAVLKSMLAKYPQPTEVQPPKEDRSEVFKRVRGKAYAKARAYWLSVGDTEKAALTDEELHEQFAWFDAEDIPRLKSELDSLEPPVGSLAYAAKILDEQGAIDIGGSFDSADADDILNAEFADYLLKRMRGEDAAE